MQRRQRGSVRDIDFEDTDDNQDTVATLSCKEINIAWDDWSAPPIIPPAPSPRRLGGRAAPTFNFQELDPKTQAGLGQGAGSLGCPKPLQSASRARSRVTTPWRTFLSFDVLAGMRATSR